MRLRGWIWILVLALLASFAVLRLRSGQAIETDLLAMLPTTERNPVAEDGVRSLAQASGNRAVFLVGGAEPERSKAAALTLAKDLESSGAFPQVQGTLKDVDPGVVPRFYTPYRFGLPAQESTPNDPKALLLAIQARLASPQAASFGLGLAQDPLGNLEGFLAQLPLNSSRMQIQDDLLVLQGKDGLYVLCTAALQGSAFDPKVQETTRLAVEKAEKHLAQAFPEVKLLRTGAVFYAIDARTRAEGEMHLISGISLVCIFLLHLIVFRSMRHLLLGLASVGAGLVTAAAVSLIFFDKLYLLTLVCGASVLGDAVDYSFLYFANHLADGKEWEPWAALRRIRKPLIHGFLTTMLGYLALMLAPFPGLRQIALFSMVGLLGAFITLFCILPNFLKGPAHPRPRILTGIRSLMARAQSSAQGRRVPITLVALALILGGLALRGRIHDDVQGFIRPSASLLADETRIRELTGFSNQGLFFLVEGASEAEALAREESLVTRLQPMVQQGELDSLQAVSSFVPSPQRQQAELEARRRQSPAMESALKQLGMRPEAIQSLRQDLASNRLLTVNDWLQAPFSTPFRHLWMGPTKHGVATLVVPMGTAEGPRLREVAQGLPGVVLVDKAASVSTMLAKDRRMASWSLGGALLLVWGLLALWYGPRAGFWLIAPPLVGILLALAGTALVHAPINLFSILGLFLVLGWGVDYTVFLRGCQGRDGAGVLGVTLAACITLVSYGLLAFSHTPALRGFGIVLGFGVLGTYLASFLALRQGRIQA